MTRGLVGMTMGLLIAPGAVAAQRPTSPLPAVRPPALVLKTPIQFTLPTITYGTPHAPVIGRGATLARFDSRTVSATSGGRSVAGTVLHLRGLKAIEQTPGISDGVRRLLEMHVRTIPRGESDHYIINTQLAEDWVKAHPVPDYVKPAPDGP